MGAIAGYYLVLALIRFMLMKSDRKAVRTDDDDHNYLVGHDCADALAE